MRSIILLLFISLCLNMGSIVSAQSSDDQLTINRLKSNLEFLASDVLEGREATTNMENVAALFLSAEMQKMGLSTFADYDNYLQKIPVNTDKITKKSEVKWYAEDGSEHLLKRGDDWVTQPHTFDKDLMNKIDDIVFCGYGIIAEEFDYDDYKNIDVNGKIVLLLWGEPENEDPNYFDGVRPSKYYGPKFKGELAKSMGAAGIIYIPDDLFSMYWRYMTRTIMISNVTLMGDNSNLLSNVPPALIISPAVAMELLTNEKHNLDEVKELLKSGNCESFPLKKKASIFIDTYSAENEIENVIGLVEGSDPVLKDEYIVIGAHYDHDGNWDGVVYNGADDNASGTVAVLEAMKRLKSAGLKRSVIGILFSGEEKGLLGSKYFVDNFPDKEKLIVNINIDMCGRDVVDSLTSKASEETSAELYRLVQEVDSEMDNMGFEYEPGINSPQGTSDHATFANAGIPAVYFGDKMRDDLHEPGDDADKINYQKVLNTVELIENLVKKIDTTSISLTSK